MFGKDSVFTSGETGAIKNTGQLVPRGLAAPSAISLADKFFLQIVNCAFFLLDRLLYHVIFDVCIYILSFFYMSSECQDTSDQWFLSVLCFEAVISF